MTASKLKFNSGDRVGFTPTSVSGFHDIKPEAVVRELVQNSSDAAGENQAVIRFSLTEMPLRDIPGIKDYRKALREAAESQAKLNRGNLPDQAKSVIDRMTACLAQDKVEMLCVTDNGMGLDSKSLTSLLSDGLSYQKGAESTGAFGNGHMVAIPTSDLRYVLYGGVVDSGRMLCSGHAMLASREGPKGVTLSNNGYLVEGFKKDFFDPYVFISGRKNIPSPIIHVLEQIRKEWKHGSAVIIPGFNRFLPRERDEFDLWSIVSRAAATNFFCAVERGELVVETVDRSSGTKRLDKDNIKRVLEEHKGQLRARRPFLSGSNAYSAYSALEQEPLSVRTSGGMVKIHLLSPITGKTRIDVCRNGMWITDDVPSYYGKFTDHQPFQCLVCVDGSSEIHSLVRKSEGPLHTEISFKRLQNREEQKKLRQCLDVIREVIGEKVPAHEQDHYSPDDILSIASVGDADGNGAGNRPGLFGQPTAVSSTNSGGVKSAKGKKRGVKKGGKKKPGQKKRPDGTGWNTRSVRFDGVARPNGARSYKVRIVPQESCENSEMRLALDEGIDGTSDGTSNVAFVAIKDVILNDERLPSAQLVTDDNGAVIGFRMGRLEESKHYFVEVRYDVPNELELPRNQHPVLGIELKKRSAPASS